jgi:hypothetical protein
MSEARLSRRTKKVKSKVIRSEKVTSHAGDPSLS